MRTIGLLGGMTWHSTIEYYRLVNTLTNERLGGSHAARCLIASVDMAVIDELMAADHWEEAGALLARDAAALEGAGAELFVLACNSMHNAWERIVAPLTIPKVHIGDATAAALDGHERVALLGTRYTMESSFLRAPIEARGIEVVVPDEHDRAELHRTVFEEFSHGVFSDATRAWYVDLIGRLDADAVIFGCTEIGLLLRPEDVDVPAYDTARVHAAAAVDRALA